MLTDQEYELARRLSYDYRQEERVQEAADIVAVYFSSEEALGVLRLREHQLFRHDEGLRMFLEVLSDLFPRTGSMSRAGAR